MSRNATPGRETSAGSFSERQLRLAIDAGRMAVWKYDIALDEFAVTPELKKLFGFPEEAVVNIADIRSLYLSGEREKIRSAAIEAIVSGNTFFEAEFRAIPHSRNDVHWFQMRAEIIRDARNHPDIVLGVMFDITEKKETEMEHLKLLSSIRDREAELSASLRAARSLVFDYDMISLKMRQSPQLNALYGYPPNHELTLADIRARYHPDMSAEYIETMVREIKDPSVREFEIDLHLLLPGNEDRWLNGRGEYMRDEHGVAYRARGVVMDATEKKKLEQRQSVLIQELDHRIKNTLAIISAIASQTFNTTDSIETARKAFNGRLRALSLAQDVVTKANWSAMDICDVVESSLAPHQGPDKTITPEGPSWRISPRQAFALTIALHELATNSEKYGALSAAGGKVSLQWKIIDNAFTLMWKELDGPAVELGSIKEGFGSKIIKQVLADEFKATCNMDFCGSGLIFTLQGATRETHQKLDGSQQRAIG